MKKLLSLPPNLVGSFHEVTGLCREEYFCTCDPIGHRLGSGGGTAWLLQEAYRSRESGVGSQESVGMSIPLRCMQREDHLDMHMLALGIRMAPGSYLLNPSTIRFLQITPEAMAIAVRKREG